MILFELLFIYGFIKLIDLIIIKLTTDIARWFKLHAFINLIVAYLSYEDVCSLIKNISSYDDISRNVYSVLIVFMLHVYHFIEFKSTITQNDIYHHLMVFWGTYTTTNYPIKAHSLTYFTANGIPGLVNYICLTAVKYNIINKITEKYINVYLNMYLRLPLGIIAGYLVYNLPYPMMQLNGFLICMNVIYFARLAVMNYCSHFYKNELLYYKQIL